jgi:hypothetical protein
MLSSPAWPAFPASRARRTAPGRSPAANCSNSAATAATTCSASPRAQASGPRTTSASAASGPLKTQQKVSGRLASDDVTQDRLDIRSYIDTARKHGKNAMDVLHDLMLGRPWRPPAAAFSP